ncbi:ADP,ATP carrier protein 1 [Candidatus Xenohaliotis californiensis]|uniref:ADP,ATP carrier protein n=1 Tax=Candidatus Xenohaliotis californiensis TaxID=84677 RepID=A0ABM9N7L3_9RICK|nr:ADP,ATP carrier protein 1 [Candidatus Xenohaliotis californiensis]
MSTQSNTETINEFSKLRSLVWPIHRYELKKFLPMSFLIFCILFIYTVARNTKDSLIATAPAAGPEAMSYLKSLFVISSAFLFVVLYAKLANIFSAEKLFYILVSFFLIYFACFAFILYPNVNSLHPNINTIHNLQESFPRLRFLFSVYAVWTYSLFYIFSELWGSVCVSLLFWQFANEIVKTNEAKRFYPLFVLIGNLSLILAGTIVSKLSANSNIENINLYWGTTLKKLMSIVIIIGIMCMIVYRWMQTNVLTDPKYYDNSSAKSSKKKKPKLSVLESFKYIFSSPYIGLIAMLVISYGMSIHLVEILWKKQLSLNFKGNPGGYNAFMGQFSRYTGIITIAIIFLTKNTIRKFGWLSAAIITPLALAISGAAFFLLLKSNSNKELCILGACYTATYVAVIVGAMQNIATKGSKYSFFDPTKEMAYIPLDQELKTKGKAAVDVVGGRLGKAGGGWAVMILFFITAAKDAMVLANYFIVIVSIIVILWIISVFALNTRYKKLVSEQSTK